MPVTKSAIKKLAQDRKREALNNKLRHQLKESVKKTAKKKGGLDSAFSIIDKAVKHNLIHKNKAARLKSGLAKLGLNTPKKMSSPKKAVSAKTSVKTATSKSKKTTAKKQ